MKLLHKVEQMESYTFDTYLSPFTWRYGSEEMRQVWSLAYERRLWRQLWVALAEAQEMVGLVNGEQVADLKAHEDDIDLETAFKFEAELHHDLMAEVHTYAAQCEIGGGIIHLGATSMDIEDNAMVLRLREAVDLILGKLAGVLKLLAESIRRYAEMVCMAFTHIQPAEPTTLGYRLAFYAQDLLADFQSLRQLRDELKGKGFKGAVGTSASYQELLKGTGWSPRDLESAIMERVGLGAFEVASQTYPRRQDWAVVTCLAGIGMTAYKFAFDLRVLQSPPFGEWGEPFAQKQVGSSAMPFKRNPVNAENMNSLARYLATLPRVLWDNAAHSLLERTLDDSGNRRSVIPEAFLIVDELLKRLYRLVNQLRVDEAAIGRNLSVYGVFAATERLMMEAVRQGGNRQELHEVIRQHSLTAWEAVRKGDANPLRDLLAGDAVILGLMDRETALGLLEAGDYVGDAGERARNLAGMVEDVVG